MDKRFKISIVMAVYNVEEFLRPAVDSLIQQDIGFENIQLIMVDDGSPDGSGAICDEYAARYPDNVAVIHKENGGVSTARNAGLDLVEGELVSFFDSDDILTPETCGNVYRFYKKHEWETDVVAIPLVFFDGETGGHTLNDKFRKGSRVIDLDKEWRFCQLSSGSAFINSDCLKDLRFDARLSYAEDAHLLQKILIRKCTIGVVKEATYLYRKRITGAVSALQAATARMGWYLPYLKYFQEDTVRHCIEKFGMVPKFIQYVLMYDIQWRLRLDHLPEGVLTEDEKQEYFQRLYGMLKYFDDEVILAQRNIFSEQKIFALKKKYGQCNLQQRDHDVALAFGNTIANKLSLCSCRMEFLRIEGGHLFLEGRLSVYDGLQDNITVFACVNGEEYPCRTKEAEVFKFSLGEPILHMCGFEADIPLPVSDMQASVELWIERDGCRIPVRTLSVGTFFPVNSQRYRNAYAVRGGWKILWKGRTLLLQRVSAGEARQCEKAYLKELWTSNKVGERKAVLGRVLYRTLAAVKRRPMWLISDRAGKAGDNGEAFFRYMRQNHPEIDAYFVLTKDSPDFERMSAIGPVLEKDSFKHKLYTLLCDYIFSSQAEADVYNPFVGYSEAYRDLLSNRKFIFLQHGITHNDLSGWLDKYNKNIYGFVTAAKPEAQSILDYKYHYPAERIWLTGFPRFDRLYRAEEKQVTIMPTWRQYLMGTLSRNTKGWSLGSNFMKSDYLAFYNGLLNHPRLLEAAARLGYRIAFFPHPNLQDFLEVFDRNDQVDFLGRETEYRDIYAKSSLVVSDYSSAIFDFAYLRKPIIYTQFDKETFYSGAHTLSRGYFDYERDGFGEVEYDLESAVDRIVEYMENGCQMKDEYRRRVDQFFAFDDQNSCQRLYEKVMELEVQH